MSWSADTRQTFCANVECLRSNRLPRLIIQIILVFPEESLLGHRAQLETQVTVLEYRSWNTLLSRGCYFGCESVFYWCLVICSKTAFGHCWLTDGLPNRLYYPASRRFYKELAWWQGSGRLPLSLKPLIAPFTTHFRFTGKNDPRSVVIWSFGRHLGLI